MITSLKRGSKVFEFSEGGAAERKAGRRKLNVFARRAISLVADFVQHGSNEFASHFGQGGAISAGELAA